MAQVKASSTVKLSVTLVLTEEEAIALNEMTKYGIDSFLKGYYNFLGRHYMQPHEEGMRSLFKTIDAELSPHLRRIADAREIFDMPKQIEPPKAHKRRVRGAWYWVPAWMKKSNTEEKDTKQGRVG